MTEDTPENQSNIGLLFETTEFTVTPGGSVEIPVVMVNNGDEASYFELSIGGIPTSWVQSQTIVRQLAPGENLEVSVYA